MIFCAGENNLAEADPHCLRHGLPGTRSAPENKDFTVMVKRLAAALFIALLTTSTAAVNSSSAQSRETSASHCMARPQARSTSQEENRRACKSTEGRGGEGL